MSDDRETVALDACGLLNLAAALPLQQAADVLNIDFVCVSQVASEALYLEEEIDGAIERVPVDLAGVAVTELTQLEMQRYVELAVLLDDGEAATLAAAQRRDLSVVTDDRKAIRVAGGLSPAVATISTASLLRRVSSQGEMSHAATADMLRRVETRASFVPPANDPDARWWDKQRRG